MPTSSRSSPSSRTPHNYAATVERNRQEQDADARPKIAGNLPDLGRYRSIILGCPVWNTRAPMIIRTLRTRLGD
ncbi:flavodoxin [Georgenia sp. SUBG003]|uniref:flavodoxin n=1 Tax=Georgenia sp. SUBG003 TaxID=1497974 RepID=UPI003AB5ADA1